MRYIYLLSLLFLISISAKSAAPYGEVISKTGGGCNSNGKVCFDCSSSDSYIQKLCKNAPKDTYIVYDCVNRPDLASNPICKNQNTTASSPPRMGSANEAMAISNQMAAMQSGTDSIRNSRGQAAVLGRTEGNGQGFIGSEVPDAYNRYMDHKKVCNEEWEETMTYCNEDKTNEFRNKIGMVSTAVDSTAPLMMGMVDACSGFAKAVKTAQGVVGLFRAKCAMEMDGCTTECAKAKKAFKDLGTQWSNKRLALAKDPQNTNKINAIDSWLKEEGDSSYEDNSFSHSRQCDAQTVVIQKASMNLMAFLSQMMQAKACEDSASASAKQDICKEYPGLAGCESNEKLDCTIAENKKKTECICAANPRDPKCSSVSLNAMQKSLNSSGGGGAGENLSSLNKNAFNPGSDPLSPDGPEGGGSPPSGGGGSGASSSGGIGSSGGGGALGGGNSGGSPAAGGAYAAPMDDSGSGGGGYSSGGGGYQAGSYTKPKSRSPSNYGAYLPGGTLDPNKNGNGDGISRAAGPNLFDKVGNRYRDNRSTLISD